MKVILICIFVCFVINSSMSKSCNTQNPNSQKGECVLFEDCPELSQYLTKNPRTKDDVEFLNARQCSYTEGEYIVCCVEPTRNLTKDVTKLPTKYLPSAPLCGIDLHDALDGGNDAQICESPWTALLQYTYPDGNKGFHCVGVLISDQYVLTASYCVNGRAITDPGYKLTGVRLGDWQLSTEKDCDQSKYKERCSEPYQDFIVEEAFPHENYEPDNANQHNDIAILRLTEKITKFSLFITPICLPIEDSIRYKNFTEKNMIVTGWGSASSFSKKDIKQKSDLKGVDTVKCQQKYTSLGQTITSKQICAGGDVSRDTCIGDSGGPLISQSLSTFYPYWFLVGVVSYGPNPCGTNDWPGVYTRVDQYIDWIINKIKP